MRLLISGGGTGGHVYPLLAVVEAWPARASGVVGSCSGADAFNAPNSISPGGPDDELDVLYVGSREGVEQRLVDSAGLEFRSVETGQLRGRGPVTAMRSIARMAVGQRRSWQLMRDYQPDAVMVTGGYVCVPVVVAARRLGHPVLIYLPDVTPGFAIRVLAGLAQQVAVTCREAAPYFGSKAIVTGYPVRQAIRTATGDRSAARRRFGLDPELSTLLAFGGSRGARSINQALVGCLPELLSLCQVVHISGHLDWPWVMSNDETLPPDLRARYHAFAYLHDDMVHALASADLVLSRAGAATLGEYPALGLPSLLVPYPHAGRHQEANARYLAERGAAEVLYDDKLPSTLLPTLRRLLTDEQMLETMGRQARALAMPEAAANIGRALRLMAGRVRAD